MTISAIGFNGNNDWMKKKLLERQAQQGTQAQGQEQVQNNAQVQDLSKTNDVDSANKVGSQMGAQGGQQALPWSNMMNDLGLKESGSKEGDIKAISTKLDLMKTEATSPADKAELASLEKEFESVKAMAGSMQPPQAPAELQNSTAGIEQLGDINKLMLVKKKFI